VPTRITLLGATGSIGRTTSDLLAADPERFHVEAVAGGRDATALAAVARRLRARFAALADPAGAQALADALAGSGIESGAGEGAVLEAAQRDADLVVAGIAGTAGLRPTDAAVRAGRTVALANKECLVCAGAAFMAGARRAGVRIMPMDSEHNAVFQALGRHRVDEVERMILTASGGPFRTWSAERIATARREEALAHPNYAMGTKVTVDSASMMNKGLELIEAHHLFGIPADRLGVLVHPQQIVHGLVTFADGAMVAGMGMPDMIVPIAHCLGYPDRLETRAPGRPCDHRSAGFRGARPGPLSRPWPGHGGDAGGRLDADGSQRRQRGGGRGLPGGAPGLRRDSGPGRGRPVRHRPRRAGERPAGYRCRPRHGLGSPVARP